MKEQRQVHSRSPRFVYFDFDGTLYDVNAVANAAVTAALEMGSELIGWDRKLVPVYTEAFWNEYFRYTRQRPILRPAEALPFLFYRTLGPDNPKIGEDHYLWDQLSSVWLDQFALHNKPFPQVTELLRWFKERGIGCGIISNGAGRYQRQKLSDLGLSEYFPEEYLFFSDEQGLAKPQPEIFHRALKSCQMSAGETIFVGDSPVTDVPGALAVGLTVIWLNRYRLTAPSTHNLPGRLYEVKSFIQAAELIKELLVSDSR
ncbi:MAG: HAD family hydrolase [bacterium]|jgi:HAD superfamily hydrolase (TIGR01549 family)